MTQTSAPGISTGVHPTLGEHFRKHMRLYVAGGVTLALSQFAMNRIDWLSRSAIDLTFSAAPATAWHPVAMILVASVLAFVMRVASRWFMFNAGRNVEYQLRQDLLKQLQRLGMTFYRRMSSGEIMSRTTNDLTQVRLLFGFGVLNIINVFFAFASALQVMTRIHPLLTLASLTNLPFLMLASRAIAKGLYSRTRANQETLGQLSECIQTNLAGLRVVRSFALESRELDRFGESNRAYLEASLKLARLRGSMGPVIGAAGALGTLVFFAYGGDLLLRGPAGGGLSKGEFFAFWLALNRMTWPMMALGFSLSIIQRGRASFVRLIQVFEAQPDVEDGPRAAPAMVDGALSVSGLSFAYGDRQVLKDVQFDVAAGKSIAVVGRTGAGKSTLTMLLCRILPTPPGTVRIDGNDICEFPLAYVRRSVGYAQQDAFLFSTSVSDNIGFGIDGAESTERNRRVAHAAGETQILNEINDLPEGFDTTVGERGVQLSGGQKQRIALARALASEPKLLILDDPMSAVDAKTEAAILDSIERQRGARTVVLVTHRTASAARCDSVIVLDDGQIVERGTHDELLQVGGIYAAFAREQQASTELDALDMDSQYPSSSKRRV